MKDFFDYYDKYVKPEYDKKEQVADKEVEDSMFNVDDNKPTFDEASFKESLTKDILEQLKNFLKEEHANGCDNNDSND